MASKCRYDHFSTSVGQSRCSDLTYLYWFYKWSQVARCILTGATRHQLPGWRRTRLQTAARGPGTCWASYCSPLVSHPPTPSNYLKADASIYWKGIEWVGETSVGQKDSDDILTVLVEVHPQPHILVKKPQSPELLQNKTILLIAHDSQDVWVVHCKVEKLYQKGLSRQQWRRFKEIWRNIIIPVVISTAANMRKALNLYLYLAAYLSACNAL